MKPFLKIVVVLVIILLLASTSYITYLSTSEDDEPENGEDDTDENNDGNDNDANGTDNGDDSMTDTTHVVLVEEGTATWCSNCPAVADVLHDLYDPENPSFYYVSMVEDKSVKARARLHDEYNIYGFPTVFIDGGYRVVMGSSGFKTAFIEKLNEATERDTPDIHMTVRAKWNESTSELTTTVTVKNYESTTYMGTLKVYITEINSRWSDWNGNPYAYAFLDYAINTEIRIKAGENATFTELWAGSMTGIYPENLWVIAVCFAESSKTQYADPPENNKKFDAYYADEAVATRVSEGALPPSIGISSPKQYVRYMFGREARKSIFGKTIIIGKMPITAIVEAEAGVEKVEFSVNGVFGKDAGMVTTAPYEWTWDSFAFGKYTITATVYDNEGRTTSNSIDVFAFIVGNLPEKLRSITS